MKKVFSKVLISMIVASVMVGALSIGCMVGNQRRSQQTTREQINQIRSSNGYLPGN